MYRRKEPGDAIVARARNQAGVISHAQLKEIGFPPGSLLRWRRNWVRMARGIHCLGEPTWESWCWAGVLHVDGVVGDAAAGHLHGFVKQQPQTISIWHSLKGSIGALGDGTVTVEFRRGERSGIGTPPRTRVERTLLDLCGSGTDDELVMAVTRAIAEGKTLGKRILAAVEDCARLRRSELIRDAVRQAESGVESVLEWKFMQLLTEHGLPVPSLQRVLVSGTRSDAVWAEFGLVVELDGALGHEEAFRDMRRDNRLAVKGILTLRFGWHDIVNNPCEVAAQVYAALHARGYRGPRPACRRCAINPAA